MYQKATSAQNLFLSLSRINIMDKLLVISFGLANKIVWLDLFDLRFIYEIWIHESCYMLLLQFFLNKIFIYNCATIWSWCDRLWICFWSIHPSEMHAIFNPDSSLSLNENKWREVEVESFNDRKIFERIYNIKWVWVKSTVKNVKP